MYIYIYIYIYTPYSQLPGFWAAPTAPTIAGGTAHPPAAAARPAAWFSSARDGRPTPSGGSGEPNPKCWGMLGDVRGIEVCKNVKVAEFRRF